MNKFTFFPHASFSLGLFLLLCSLFWWITKACVAGTSLSSQFSSTWYESSLLNFCAIHPSYQSPPAPSVTSFMALVYLPPHCHQCDLSKTHICSHYYLAYILQWLSIFYKIIPEFLTMAYNLYVLASDLLYQLSSHHPSTYSLLPRDWKISCFFQNARLTQVCVSSSGDSPAFSSNCLQHTHLANCFPFLS